MVLGLSWPKIGPPRAWVRLPPGEGAMSPPRKRWAAWQEESSWEPCAKSSLALAEWRSGVAGHLILSDEDVTSELQGLWRRLNTLQHYKVGKMGAGGWVG